MEVVGFSIGQEDIEQLEEISQITGYNKSALIRSFIHYFYNHKGKIKIQKRGIDISISNSKNSTPEMIQE